MRDRLAPVSRPLQALTVQSVEVDAVGLVSDQEVEHGPDQALARWRSFWWSPGFGIFAVAA
jgi:hypothetical protein